MRIVKNSLAKLSSYPRLRILLIIAAIIVVFIVVMNLLIAPSTKNNAAPPSEVQSVSSNNTQNQKPVTQADTNNYQTLASTDAQNTAEQAAQTGGSDFQNAINNNPDTASPPATTSTSTNPALPNGNTSKPQLATDVAGLQKQLNADSQANQSASASQNQASAADAAAAAQKQQAMNAEFQSIQSSMRSGLENVTNSWQLPTLSSVAGTAPSESDNGTMLSQAPVAIKAGTILFGVIDTALDSDQPGTPVLATIVTGPYKGSKLLGGFVAEKNALVIQFNLMTIPSQPSSIPISAYAIDENTANNALASNVDNHYLLRYGMLFASAFLQGFGTAYQNTYYCPPGTQYCNIYSTGSNAPPDNSTTVKTATYQGFGQVGTTLGQVAAQQFNTPPTITVNQGTAIGVLFNADLQIPT